MIKKMDILKSKYNNASLELKASLWYVFCNIINKGIAFITTPIFTRIMSTEEFGQVTLYNSWYSILSIFATLNLFYGVYNNGMTKYPNQKKEFTSSMLGLCTTITLVCFIFYLLCKDFWNNLFGMTSLFIIIMFIQLLFYPAIEFWTAKKRYEYDYKNLVILSILISFVSTIIGIILVKMSVYKALVKVLSLALVNILVGVALYIKILKSGKVFFSKHFWKYGLLFNIPLIPHYFSSIILSQADRIMISKISGIKYAAIYSIAYSIAMLLNIVTSALTNAITPYTYQSLKNKNFFNLKKISNILSIVMAMLCIVITLFAPEIVRIMGTQEYMESIYIIPPVATSIFFIFLYPLFSNIEFYYEKTKFIMFASSVSAILNIILNYIFINIYGYLAAGYTTLLCYVIYTFSHYLFSKRILKNNHIKNVYNGKFLLIISVLLCLICVLISFIYPFYIIRYLLILLLFLGVLFFYKKIKKMFQKLFL